MREMPNYYAIIPANVRYDKELRANEKLMYGEITALSNKLGECWASNQYFAELYQVTPQAVSKWISNLKNKGYITVELTYKEGSKEIDKRIIRIGSTNVSEVSTNDCGGINKSLIGYQQKIKDNNINNNNININKHRDMIKDRIKDFVADDKELEEAFLDFIDMRKKIKKPLTSERAVNMIIMKLKEMSGDRNDWIAILNQSILHNWQSVYPLKKEKPQETKNKYINYDQRDTNYSELEEILLNR